MTRLTHVTAFALALCVALTCTSAGALTKQQATSAAIGAFESLGYPAPQQGPAVELRETKFGPMWHVVLGPDCDAEMSELSGKIVALHDWRAESLESAPSPITKEEAERLAIDHLKKALGGLPGEAQSVAVEPRFGESRDRPGMWFVTWQRKIGSYRVSPDQLAVTVNAQTGRLVGFRNNFVTPAPASMEPTVTRGQAVEIARKEAGGRAEQSVEIIVVDPDHMKGMKPYGRRSVVAWVVRLAGRDHMSVTVDGQTGEILGVAMAMGVRAKRVGPSSPRSDGGAPGTTTQRERTPRWVWLALACVLLVAAATIYVRGVRARPGGGDSQGP